MCTLQFFSPTVKSAESRIFDVILVDERLASLITIPSLQSGSRNILIPEIFWLRKEQPPPEPDMACCADFWYFEEGGSEAPTDDVSECLGWLYPAAGVAAVVRHLRWEESILVYDFLNGKFYRENMFFSPWRKIKTARQFSELNRQWEFPTDSPRLDNFNHLFCSVIYGQFPLYIYIYIYHLP